MDVSIAQGACIGCGACVALAPAVFRLTANDTAEAYASVEPADEAMVRKAARICPVDVIFIEET